MSDFHQTADALDRMAVQQQAIIDAAAEFRKLGSIDASTKALEDLNKVAQTELSNTNRALAHAESRRQAAEEQAGVAREQGELAVAKMLAEAEQSAAEIRAAAKAEADGVVAKARADMQRFEDDLREELRAARESLMAERAETERLREEKVAIERAVGAAQSRLEEINAKLRSMLEAK